MISKKIIDESYKKFNNKNFDINYKNIIYKRLDKYLLDENYLNFNELLMLWNTLFNVNINKITLFDINNNTINKIPWELMDLHQVIPFDETNKKIKLLIEDPLEIQKIFIFENYFNKSAEIYCGSKEEIKQMINFLSMNRENSNSKIEKLLESIIINAFNTNVSDIHFDIHDQKVFLLYRIDGSLKKIMHIDVELYKQLVTKIKIYAKLDVSINLYPQDGHYSFKKGKKEIDIRVSTIPTIDGERLVLRILTENAKLLSLEQLGFSEKQYYDIVNSVVGGGIIFLTGPTGSGKTTTLYALLEYLKKYHNSIMTIEDPVERKIEGITQIPLNMMNYPTILKSIMRQDPDIIMVGEIRDVETANLVIRMAQTGHLVLTTIHAKDSLGVISRLENIGIPKYLIADSLKLIISQRLIKKECPYCKKNNLKGCNKCFNTGFLGRQMIAEVIKFDDEINNLFMYDNYKQLIREKKKAFLFESVVQEYLEENKIDVNELVLKDLIK